MGQKGGKNMDPTKRCTTCYSEIHPQAVVCPHCHFRQPNAAPLHRGAPGRILGGVCAGLAQYLGVDVSLVRVVVAFATLISGGIICTAYFMLWAVTPPSADEITPLARFVNAVRDLFSPKQRPAGGTTSP